MTVAELKEKCAFARSHGLERVILVVTRKTPPGRFKNDIRVKGLGVGEVCNCTEKNGLFEIVAWFRCDVIEKNIMAYEKVAGTK